ncbi:MAG: sulfatase-like hydrolase/transferase [Alphaproteobacteria bacterium]|nr:sulfatase-like hydrolase/transferase [Alphaproteobacteria bacterium]
MRSTGLAAVALLWGFGCTGAGPRAPTGAQPVSRAEVGQPFAFAREIDQAIDLALPESSRPGGEATPEQAPLMGPFKLIRVVKGVAVYETPSPIRSRSLFFTKQPPGMVVVDGEGEALRFDRATNHSAGARTWGNTAETVVIRLPEARGAPEPGEFKLRYPRALQRERSLNFAESGLEDHAFAARSVQLGPDTRTGLYLPAPALASWQLSLPAAATLQLDATILPPELDVGQRSDGASLELRITEASGREEVVLQQPVRVAEWTPLRVDLSRWAGQEVRLTFRTDPGDSETLDYVFLAEPTVYTPTTEPRRLLMVFLDTVRADHLSMYGYARDTTPRLNAWSEGAVVFEQARSVAPWTLPSTRAVLSGRQPELWKLGPRVQERLAELGWATGAFVGNVYLSANFDMSGGWSQYGCVNWPLAEVQVDKVQDFLQRHEGRDVAVMIHTMDAHLPYTEPDAYRDLWAGEAPADLTDRSTRSPILKAARGPEKEVVKQWLIDRYDQNLRYLDDQIADLIEEMGPNTTVVVFADHGEEFWDHGQFEHGHALYDELLRVPLIISSPGLGAGRVDAPVQLIDVTPTVLDLLGLAPGEVDGQSLLPVARGEAGAAEALAARPLAFGRPLYGDERWGVLDGELKWTTHAGAETVFDLGQDPGEATDLLKSPSGADLVALRGAMGEALEREVPVSWRVDTGRSSRTLTEDVVLEIAHPGGIRAAWMGADPLQGADMSLEGPDDFGVVRVTFHPGASGGREVFLVPEGDPLDIEGLRFASGMVEKTAGPSELTRPDGKRQTLWRVSIANRGMSVTWGLAPVPGEGAQVEGMDDEVEEALNALGYKDHAAEEGKPEEAPKPDAEGDAPKPGAEAKEE